MTDGFDKMMAELKEQYFAQLPDKLKILQTLIKEKNLTDLHEHFHKLKGTGKTYGLPEISDIGLLGESLTTDDRFIMELESLILLLEQVIIHRKEHNEPYALQDHIEFKRLKDLI